MEKLKIYLTIISDIFKPNQKIGYLKRIKLAIAGIKDFNKHNQVY
jgi:hypothetical protein